MHRSLGFLVALLAILLCPLAARAADLEPLVQQLGADSFEDKVEAIKALGALGDSRAIVALKALNDSRLYTAKGGKVVIAEENGDKAATFDPVTRAALGEVPADSIERVVVNNRLRGLIAESLGSLILFSDKRDERSSAAREALKNPTPEGVPALKRALEHETEPDIRQALTLAIAASQIGSADKNVQLAAIAEMAKSSDPDIYGLLRQYRNDKDLDPDVRSALVSAIGGIERRQELIGIVQNLFEGLSLGSVLLLAAIGLAITFGVMGVINMAHGEMIMIGAYTTYVVQEIFITALPPGWLDAYLVAAVPIAFLVAGAAGIVIERGVIRFLYGRPLETMLATWGVSLILQQLVRSIFGAPNKAVANPSWMTGGFELIGGGIITWNRVVILVFCFVVLGVLALVLRRTSFGLHMRAVTQNRGMAAAMGIPTSRVDALTFGLGSGIAGIAGVALSQIGNVSPNLGQIYIVDSFLVVVFGGVGNLAGTLVGAMTLGIVNKLLEPVAGAVLGKIVVLLAIILFIQKRPRGLFALKGRAAEGDDMAAPTSAPLLDRRSWLWFLGVGAVLIVGVPLLNGLPEGSAFHLSDYLVPLFGKYVCYALLALSMDLIWGYAGILSLGQGAFFALGGYAMGMYLMRQIGTRGVYGNPVLPDFMVFLNWPALPWYWYGFNHFLFAALMIVLAPGIVAFVFGWFAFRSRVTGVYLSIITQALTYALLLAFFRNDMGFGGNNGLTDFKDILGFDMHAGGTRLGLYIASVVMLGLGFLACRFIVQSKLGRILLALRDAENRVRFLGYSVEYAKLFVFTIAAAMAGIAGALYVTQVGIINPGEFSPANSIEIAIWVAVGGRGTLIGAMIGAVLVNFGKTWLTDSFPDFWLFFLGGLFVLVTLAMPKGIVGVARQLWASRRRPTPPPVAQEGTP